MGACLLVPSFAMRWKANIEIHPQNRFLKGHLTELCKFLLALLGHFIGGADLHTQQAIYIQKIRQLTEPGMSCKEAFC